MTSHLLTRAQNKWILMNLTLQIDEFLQEFSFTRSISTTKQVRRWSNSSNLRQKLETRLLKHQVVQRIA